MPHGAQSVASLFGVVVSGQCFCPSRSPRRGGNCEGRGTPLPLRAVVASLAAAHIGQFKPLVDFDWAWPKRCDRVTIEELMTLARNLAHQALVHGHTDPALLGRKRLTFVGLGRAEAGDPTRSGPSSESRVNAVGRVSAP